MPADTAVLAAQKFRAQLLAKERASAVRLVDSYGAIWQRLQTQIDLLAADIDAMSKAGTLKPWRVGQLDRLKSLQRQVQDEINRYAVIVENEVTQGAKAAILQAQADAKALTQAALPGVVQLDAAIMARWQSLNPGAVESLLGFMQPDSPLMAGMRERFGAEIAKSIGDKLVQGIGLGYNPRKTASIIQREMGQGLNSALRLSRTAQLYAYRESTRASYAANPEIVKGWEWRSARDGRSCMSCVAMDGTHHKVDETLDDHWQGRCSMLPDVIDYADLGLNVPRRQPTIEHPTGEDWFNAQPETMQRAMMGPGKFKAWKAGDIKLADLVHEQSDPVWGKMRSERSLKAILGDGGTGGAPAKLPPKPGPTGQVAPTQPIRHIEQSIRKNSVESAHVYDGNGKLIFSQQGTSGEVAFGANQLAEMRGNILTHNHPNNMTFSATDIAMAHKNGLREIRAITDTHQYSWKIPTGNNATWDTMSARYEEVLKDRTTAFKALVQQGKMTVDQATNQIYHTTWARIAHEFGTTYKRTPWTS